MSMFPTTKDRHCGDASRLVPAICCLIGLLPALASEGRERDLFVERPDWEVASAFPVSAGAPSTALALDLDGVADLVLTRGTWRGTVLRPGGVIASQRTPLFPGGIARRGDLNGDGRDDVVLANPGADNRRGFNFLGGRVAVFWTPRRAPDAPAELLNSEQGDWTLMGGFETSLLGLRVDVGDVNGDGFADLVSGGISQNETELGGSTDTCIYGVFGPLQDGGVIDLVTDSTDFRICQTQGGPTNCSFGQSMAVGDLDGDGFEDLAASCSDGVRVFRGQRLLGDVDWGTPDTLIAFPSASRGQPHPENLPLVATDVDSDGRDDLFIGLADGDGEVDLVLGRAVLPPLIDLNVTPPDLAVLGRAGTGLGASMAVGHFTTDGTLNLVLGAPRSDGPGDTRADAGAVEVLGSLETLRGVVDLATMQPAELLHGAAAGDALGSGQWGIGLVVEDVNGDGIDDVAMHSPGPRGEVWYGTSDVIFGQARGTSDIWHATTDPSALALLAPDVTSPWDAASGLRDDGALHFFRLEDSAPGDRTIFVTKQETGRTVRISWLDSVPSRVVPDVALSSVVASAACASADGRSVVEITVTPRDAAGDLLGAGLDVRPAAPTTWSPGVPGGGFRDRGDGTYVIPVTALAAGSAAITVQVEGRVLSDSPVIDFSAGSPMVTALATPPGGMPGIEVTLSSNVTGGTPPYAYSWDVDGDGRADSAEETPRHVYDAGAWRAVVTVTDAAGCVGRGSVGVTVRP